MDKDFTKRGKKRYFEEITRKFLQEWSTNFTENPRNDQGKAKEATVSKSS